jgi:hypothetical protein
MNAQEIQYALEQTLFAIQIGDEEALEEYGHYFDEFTLHELRRIEAEPSEEATYQLYLAILNSKELFA